MLRHHRGRLDGRHMSMNNSIFGYYQDKIIRSTTPLYSDN
jgi:hypothetical protein